MSSTERDSSIASSSIFIPSWVKNKIDNSGFDPSALSPPMHDGEFFYVKFPRSEKSEPRQFEVVNLKEEYLANHTASCKKFIPQIQDSVPIVKPKIIKPMGVDDGFKGEGAACGASVVAVAQQMISGGSKSPVRGFTTDDAGEKPSANYLRQRRNSKSLPASPSVSPETSPRTRRKNATSFALQNRFNPGIVAAASISENDELEKKSRSSWILSGLFSQSRESGLIVKNQENSIAAEERTKGLSDESSGLMNKANLNVTLEVKPTDLSAAPILDRKVYKKKRSEIRELNFISPVSM